jgi:uncharacterized membrane protein YuzA (DUF378 family)
MKTWLKVALVLANVGAINWGLFALSPKAELIQYLQVSWLMTVVYLVVGLCGVVGLYKVFK